MGGGARRRHRGRSELGSLNRRTSVVVPRSELGKGVQELIGDRLSRVGWNVVVPSLVLMFAASKEGEVRDDSPPQ